MSTCNCEWKTYSTSELSEDCPSQLCHSNKHLWDQPPYTQEYPTDEEIKELQDYSASRQTSESDTLLADLKLKRKEIIKEEKQKRRRLEVEQQEEKKVQSEEDAEKAFRQVKYLTRPDGVQFKSSGALLEPKNALQNSNVI